MELVSRGSLAEDQAGHGGRVAASDSKGPGVLRRLLLTLGQFSLVAVGLHAGADSLDDLATSALLGLDRGFDSTTTQLFGWLGSSLGYGPRSVERWSELVTGALDADDARRVGRGFALGIELLFALLLSLPVLFTRNGTRKELVESARGLGTDFTVLRLALPSAIVLSSLGGALIISQQAGNVLSEAAFGVYASHELVLSAGFFGALFAFLGTFLALGLRGAARTAVFAHRRANEDLRTERSSFSRRSRGTLLLAVIPLAWLGVAETLPIVSEIIAGIRP
ncbi:MAG: hypothetical protein HYV07_04210 [Deltaproteobacteria bacterium]|nr:hypothetical protein [Deltaproteobacteria bacterium]